MTANPADAVREALEKIHVGLYPREWDAEVAVILDALPGTLDHIAALTARVAASERDAQRFNDLCELVQAGEWGLCELEVTDKFGNMKEHWQDGIEDIPAFCDKWANAAATWRKVRTKADAAMQEPQP